ncbi:hypothetical protein TI04_02945 [Achromatium sp. WMS2]|nr:hypothetical protein TI04_02945 [Achromatium sp. WMS2]
MHNDPNSYLASLQGHAQVQGKAEFATLVVQYGSVLGQFPKLQQEIKALQQQGDGVDYEKLTQSVQAKLERIANFLFQIDQLPPELAKSGEMQKFIKTAKSNINLAMADSYLAQFVTMCSATSQTIHENRQWSDINALMTEYRGVLTQLPRLQREINGLIKQKKGADSRELIDNIQPTLEQAAEFLLQVRDLPRRVAHSREMRSFISSAKSSISSSNVDSLLSQLLSMRPSLEHSLEQESIENKHKKLSIIYKIFINIFIILFKIVSSTIVMPFKFIGFAFPILFRITKIAIPVLFRSVGGAITCASVAWVFSHFLITLNVNGILFTIIFIGGMCLNALYNYFAKNNKNWFSSVYVGLTGFLFLETCMVLMILSTSNTFHAGDIIALSNMMVFLGAVFGAFLHRRCSFFNIFIF